MKKVFFAALLLLSIHGFAQSYQDIRNACALQQYSKAKADLDKAMNDPVFTSKPEAYILKAAVYGPMAADALKTNPALAESLIAGADAAFTKYKEKDATMQLMSDALYQNGPINLYTVYYSLGYADYSQQKWKAAFDKISKAVNYSDLLIQEKLIAATLDTNVLVLAGIVAENNGNKLAAVAYYSRLANAGVNGAAFESVYRYLVKYYFEQKNFTLFEKYKALGKNQYPSSEYFSYDKVDFALGSVTGFDSQYAAAQSILKDEPGNFKANEVLGEIIYEELNKRFGKGPDAAATAQLENTMISAFKKAISIKPDFVNAYLYQGDYFINKAVTIDQEKNSTTDAAKKTALDSQYAIALESAREPYEKAAALFEKNSSLNDKDKAQYKKAVSYLADIAQYKRAKAVADTEKNKWAAEQARWKALYESIK